MITHLWHTILDMPKRNEKWHEDDVKKELEEYREAKGFFECWSEVSDVVYTYTRAKWSGYKKIKWPLSWLLFWCGWIYMFPKFTLRWLFYFWIGRRLGAKRKVTEVRNYKKEEKLRYIARKYKLDEKAFISKVRKLARFWIFLP